MTEAELCAEFMDWARGRGHRCYPEWAGWDVLVVDEDGTQIGVEAKTRANVKVLHQAMSPNEHWPGPDYHAVLVPKASYEFRIIAKELRLTTIRWEAVQSRQRFDQRWGDVGLRPLPVVQKNPSFCWAHPKRHALPPVEELDKPAGVPSPGGLTPWKLSAIRVWLRMERQGYLTSADFKAEGISVSTWKGRWIQWDGTKIGRLHRYVEIPAGERHEHDRRPDELHPEAVAAMRDGTITEES